MTEPYGGRTLLIGLGNIGIGYDLVFDADEEHPVARRQATVRTHAAAIEECIAMELVGGVDPSMKRRIEFEEAFDRPAWASLEDMPDVDVDIVVLATPTETHGAVAAQALSAFSPRLLVCEKPVGTSADDMRAILALAERQGTTMIVNYFRQYLPIWREVRERLRRGELGTFTGGIVLYSHGLRRNGSHFVALLLWLLGDAAAGPGPGPADSGADPAFTLSFGHSSVVFSSLGHGGVRAAEICLGFSGGMLRAFGGGQSVSWAPVGACPSTNSPSYGELAWQRDDDMLRCQSPIYSWATSTGLAAEEVAGDVSVALRTQEILDEVLGEVNHGGAI